MTGLLSQQALDFLWELSLHNERPWFQEHKEEFEAVLYGPFKELAAETERRMQARFPRASLQVHVSRIYRDARRLFGRGPYHDHLWFSLQRSDHQHQGPMFWFQLGLTGTEHGLGFWERTADQAAAFRRKIDGDPQRFERLILGIPDREKSRLWGEEYKRPKGRHSELIDPWYNRKQASVGYENYFGEKLFSEELPELLTESFAGLMKLYQFFMEAAMLNTREALR